MKKKIILGVIALFLSSTLWAQVTSEGFFAGGKLVNRGFTISGKNSGDYSDSSLGLSVGYQLSAPVRLMFDYFPEKEFSGPNRFPDVKLNTYVFSAEYVKPFDKFYFGIGGHMENIDTTYKYSNGSSKSGPSGLVFGINLAGGYSFGQVGVEFNLRRSLTTVSKDSVDYENNQIFGLAVNYHF